MEIETERPAAALAAVYNEQLQAAGWRNLTVGNSEYAAWNQWTFEDEDGDRWAGSLYIFANPTAPRHKTAILRADQWRE